MKAFVLASVLFVSSISFANTISIGEGGNFQTFKVLSLKSYDATLSMLVVRPKNGIKSVIVSTEMLSHPGENASTAVSFGELLTLIATHRANITCYGKSSQSGSELRVAAYGCQVELE